MQIAPQNMMKIGTYFGLDTIPPTRIIAEPKSANIGQIIPLK